MALCIVACLLACLLFAAGAQAFAPPKAGDPDGGDVDGASTKYFTVSEVLGSSGQIASVLDDGLGRVRCTEVDDISQLESPANGTIVRQLAPLATPEDIPTKKKTGIPTGKDVLAWASKKVGIPVKQLKYAKGAILGTSETSNGQELRHFKMQQFGKVGKKNMLLETSAIHVHIKNGKTAYLITGGYVPDLVARLPARAADADATTIDPARAVAAAAVVALDAAPDAPEEEVAALKAMADDLAEAAAVAVTAAAADDAGAGTVGASSRQAQAPLLRGKAPAGMVRGLSQVITCLGDGSCVPAYKQVFFIRRRRRGAPSASELHVYVDALDGSRLYYADRLRTRRAPGSGAAGAARRLAASSPYDPVTGSGRGLYTGNVSLNLGFYNQPSGAPDGGPYIMRDYVNAHSTVDGNNKDPSFQAAWAEFVSQSADGWGDGKLPSTNRATAAVDVHYAGAMTLEYYKTVHGRDSLDGKGMTIYSVVHAEEDYDNAYYAGADWAAFGDGSRGTVNETCTSFWPLVTLPIAAHEWTHGVTQYTSNLIYVYSWGGLNEALSDVMSSCVSDWAHRVKGHPTPNSWLMGPELFPSPPKEGCNMTFLRNMRSPTEDNSRSFACWDPAIDMQTTKEVDGTMYSCTVNVHHSSGIMNRAFYLMAEGFNASGCPSNASSIGFEASCSIVYRAMSQYMTPITDYFGARVATAQAAKDLFGEGSKEEAAVGAAWDVVGVPTDADGNHPKCQPKFATSDGVCA